MPIICTWNEGTPLGSTGVRPPVSYEIEGILGNRTGQNLHEAIEDEAGLARGTVTVVGDTEVHVDGVWRLTLSASTDGGDAPANNGIARHLRWMLRHWRGDRRTLAWMVLKMIMRWARHEWGLTEAQAGAIAQRAWRATSTANGDGP